MEWDKIMPKSETEARYCRDLARNCGVAEITFKRKVKRARLNGVPILSSNKGYWITDNLKEFDVFADKMKRQAVSRFAINKAVREALTKEVME